MTLSAGKAALALFRGYLSGAEAGWMKRGFEDDGEVAHRMERQRLKQMRVAYNAVLNEVTKQAR
jgi:hypothetical protein